MLNPFRNIGPQVETRLLLQASPWIALGIVLLLTIATVGGFWAGHRWATNAQARVENKDLKADIDQLQKAAQALRQSGVDIASDFRTAANRQYDIAQENEDALAKNRQFYQAQGQQLEQLLHARPDLDAVDVGPDLLCAWNQANQGRAGGTAAAPGCRSEPDATVPGAAAGAGRKATDAHSQPPGGGGGASRLRRSAQRTDPGREGIAGNGVGLVLQGDGRARAESAGLR